MSNKNNVNSSVYGFELKNKIIEIKAKNEQQALIKLVQKCWHLIDKTGKVKLLGSIIKPKTLNYEIH